MKILKPGASVRPGVGITKSIPTRGRMVPVGGGTAVIGLGERGSPGKAPAWRRNTEILPLAGSIAPRVKPTVRGNSAAFVPEKKRKLRPGMWGRNLVVSRMHVGRSIHSNLMGSCCSTSGARPESWPMRWANHAAHRAGVNHVRAALGEGAGPTAKRRCRNERNHMLR